MTIDDKQTAQRGFTLLEILLVLFILGMIAALALPAMGRLDDYERERLTRERMELIRRAVLGPDDRFDAGGRPVVGGYVGDMRAWPDLWEARAEIKPNFAGVGWENPASMAAGLGQGPDYTVDPDLVFFRPSGRFVDKRWKWHLPYRRLYDDPAGSDHIGGLETENEGQPRGLWTRYPEELPFDIGSHAAPGLDLGEAWKGPYLMAPHVENPADSDHWAEADDEYEALEPLWHPGGAHANHETWEDGSYDPTDELGEHFDEKESFRLLQSEWRLVDGWGRVLRFFITADPDHPGSTIFWILSEGPDQEGTYPGKGTCPAHAWSVDLTDVMATAYDENDEKNRDNIVLRLYSRDWEAVFAAEEARKKEETRAALDAVRKALAGAAPDGLNCGFTGDLARRPRLFRWEDNGTPADTTDDYWDDENEEATPVAYTKGQLRGLWTAAPNSSDSGDDLETSQWGIGWRHAYIKAPVGSDGDQVLRDAWNREILFFHDAVNGLWLILSRGADGLFDFGATNAEQTEPENFTEAVDVTSYDPTASQNADNCHIVVAESDWLPGFFRLPQLTVYDAAANVTKARFFRDDGAAVAGVDLLIALTLTDADSDTLSDDWVEGDGTPVNPAFNYDDTTTQTAASGARYLVVWNDSDSDDIPDSGESGVAILYNVTAAAGSGQQAALVLDADNFAPLP
jgi:prepilin-type N-terminal cleavage/methylation domain-containing protein